MKNLECSLLCKVEMLFLILICLGFSTISEAAPLLETEGVVQVLGDLSGPLGAGVVLGQDLVLTARHVVEAIDVAQLKVKDSRGVSHLVSKVFYPKAPQNSRFFHDYAFLVVSDLAGKCSKIQTQAIPARTTLMAYEQGVLEQSKSDHNLEKNGLLLHCSESVPGYSGAPIYNPAGELVAIQNGVMRMKCFCPGQDYVSIAIPLARILDLVPTELPEVLPYFGQGFCSQDSGKSK